MKSLTRYHRFAMFSTIVSFVLISFALLAITRNPAEGYELSIYSATPLVFWIAILVGLINGILLLVLSMVKKVRRMWIIGMFEIILCNCLVISLYALRGYTLYLGRGDAASYVGMSLDVHNYGLLFDYNFYPITSILVSGVSQTTDIPVLVVSKYLSSFFFIVYILSIYSWSKLLVLDRRYVFASVIASTPIFFAWFSTSTYPMLLSVLTIPLFFYCLQRSSDYRFRFLSIIWLVLYPFFHPITAIIIFLYLALTFTSERWYPKCKKRGGGVSTILLLISFVSLATWFTSQYLILGSMKSVILQLLGSLELPSTVAQSQYYLNELGMATALWSFLMMTADEIIFYSLSLAAIFLLIKKDRKLFDRGFASGTACLVGGSLFIAAIFVFAYAHTPSRLINLNPNMMLTPPLVGYLLYRFSLRKRKNKAVLLVALITIPVVSSVFSLYPSPMTTNPNDQVTYSEVVGMDWLISHKDPDIKTADVMTPVSRYSDLLYGHAFTLGRKDLYSYLTIQDHFGFTNRTLPMNEDRYLVITEYDVQAYTKVWKNIHRFEEEDFVRINLCQNVDRIYTNREIEFYFVRES